MWRPLADSKKSAVSCRAGFSGACWNLGSLNVSKLKESFHPAPNIRIRDIQSSSDCHDLHSRFLNSDDPVFYSTFVTFETFCHPGQTVNSDSNCHGRHGSLFKIQSFSCTATPLLPRQDWARVAFKCTTAWKAVWLTMLAGDWLLELGVSALQGCVCPCLCVRSSVAEMKWPKRYFAECIRKCNLIRKISCKPLSARLKC